MSRERNSNIWTNGTAAVALGLTVAIALAAESNKESTEEHQEPACVATSVRLVGGAKMDVGDNPGYNVVLDGSNGCVPAVYGDKFQIVGHWNLETAAAIGCVGVGSKPLAATISIESSSGNVRITPAVANELLAAGVPSCY